MVKQLKKEALKISRKKDAEAFKILNELKNYEIIMQDEQLPSWQENGHGKAINHGVLGRLKNRLMTSDSHHVRVLHKHVQTTQLCTNCGELNKLELSERVYKCSCGYEKDRDVHAGDNCIFFAENIDNVFVDNFDWKKYNDSIRCFFAKKNALSGCGTHSSTGSPGKPICL